MSPELIGITTVGMSLAVLIIGLFAWLRQDMQEQGNRLGREIKEQGQKHSNEITEVKVEVAALKATVETYFRVRVDPPRQAAVAESPEDYGAG